ncbi:MAG: DUF4867 family protein [Clostridia bacterium]|nr:DUF4867 family protein [Clostridia bacterium]
MKVYKITDLEFREYGRVLQGHDFYSLFKALSDLEIPDTGITYEPSIKKLEENGEFYKIVNRGFGGMPIQIGYVGGKNKILNCLEYHKSSEFNVALDDVILILGKQTEMEGDSFDTSRCKAFLIPAGQGVELFATTRQMQRGCVVAIRNAVCLQRVKFCVDIIFRLLISRILGLTGRSLS